MKHTEIMGKSRKHILSMRISIIVFFLCLIASQSLYATEKTALYKSILEKTDNGAELSVREEALVRSMASRWRVEEKAVIARLRKGWADSERAGDERVRERTRAALAAMPKDRITGLQNLSYIIFFGGILACAAFLQYRSWRRKAYFVKSMRQYAEKAGVKGNR